MQNSFIRTEEVTPTIAGGNTVPVGEIHVYETKRGDFVSYSAGQRPGALEYLKYNRRHRVFLQPLTFPLEGAIHSVDAPFTFLVSTTAEVNVADAQLLISSGTADVSYSASRTFKNLLAKRDHEFGIESLRELKKSLESELDKRYEHGGLGYSFVGTRTRQDEAGLNRAAEIRANEDRYVQTQREQQAQETDCRSVAEFNEP